MNLYFHIAGMAALIAVTSIAQPPAAWGQTRLVLERTIPLDGVAGRIDHMAIDDKRGRLIVAELGNNTVDVIGLDVGKVIHRIEGLWNPQGVGYSAKADVIVVANGGDGSVRIFRTDDFAEVGTIALGDDADNVRVSPRDGAVVVGYGSGALAIVDPATRTKLAEIALPGHPESFQIDAATDHVFVNVPTARQIVVADLNTRHVLSTWKYPAASENFPMALDTESRLLATVYRSQPRLVLFRADTGSVAAERATCGDFDDVFFDNRRHRIYVSCGSGEVHTFDLVNSTLGTDCCEDRVWRPDVLVCP
jgi:DNA-binding beta-propeller fold protein YncE